MSKLSDKINLFFKVRIPLRPTNIFLQIIKHFYAFFSQTPVEIVKKFKKKTKNNLMSIVKSWVKNFPETLQVSVYTTSQQKTGSLVKKCERNNAPKY